MNPVGLLLQLDGQTYEIISRGIEIAGEHSAPVLEWRSSCAECNAEFRFKTRYKLKTEFNRRCKQHRAPGIRVRRQQPGVHA
jgi:hypothetical protein